MVPLPHCRELRIATSGPPRRWPPARAMLAGGHCEMPRPLVRRYMCHRDGHDRRTADAFVHDESLTHGAMA